MIFLPLRLSLQSIRLFPTIKLNPHGIARDQHVRADRRLLDIGTLGGDYSVAYGLTDSGQVVDSSAHLGNSLRGLLRRPTADCAQPALRFKEAQVP